VPTNASKDGALIFLWGGNYVVGSNIHVYPGDTIVGTLDANSCSSAGACTWDETVSDLNSNSSSEYTIHSDSAFRDLDIEDLKGDFPSPSFGTSAPFPECSIRETAAPTGADIYWAP
jgi:hypothetical protein